MNIDSGIPAEQRKVIAEGLFTTLTQYGYRLAAEGLTSMDEVERVTGMG